LLSALFSINDTIRHDDLRAPTTFLYATDNKFLSSTDNSFFSSFSKFSVTFFMASGRMVSLIENKAESNQTRHKLAQQFRVKLEEELDKICKEVLSLLDDNLTKNVTSDESMVFYLKMMGDYYRYMAEYSPEEKKKDIVEDSQKAYMKAMDLAKEKMASTHPSRLGLALNFSVFYYEILNGVLLQALRETVGLICV
jgi:hypothetical protein